MRKIESYEDAVVIALESVSPLKAERVAEKAVMRVGLVTPEGAGPAATLANAAYRAAANSSTAARKAGMKESETGIACREWAAREEERALQLADLLK